MTNIRDEGPDPYVIPLSADGSEVLSFDPHELSGWAAFHSASPAWKSAGIPLMLRIGPQSGAVGDLRKITAEEPLEIREVRYVTKGPAVSLSSALRVIPWERIEAAINHPKHRKAIIGFVQPHFAVADSLPGKFGPWMFKPATLAVPPKLDLRLDIPEGYRKPDEFYRSVAELFLSLAAISSRPAQEIAEANGVKPTTVHGWVREAKARGFLVLPKDGSDRR